MQAPEKLVVCGLVDGSRWLMVVARREKPKFLKNFVALESCNLIL